MAAARERGQRFGGALTVRTLLALCALVLRALRPSRGSHAAPREPRERLPREHFAAARRAARKPLASNSAAASPRTAHRSTLPEPRNGHHRAAREPRNGHHRAAREPRTGTAESPRTARGNLAERSGHVHRGESADARRAARGRCYAELLPATAAVDPYGPPLPMTPVVRAENVNPQAALIRGYYIAFEREHAKRAAQ